MSENKELGKVDNQLEPSSPSASAPTPTELPPSYDITQSQTQPQLQGQPQAPEDLPTLVLDGTKIYSVYAPNRLLYELSNSPCEGRRIVFGVEKLRYRVVDTDAEAKLRFTRDHIYDFHHGISFELFDRVDIVGQTSRKRTYPKMSIFERLGPGIQVGPTDEEKNNSEWVLEAGAPLKDRLNQGKTNTVVWKHREQVIAIETKLQRDKDKNIQELPRLAIKARIDEKLYDLLVTCWCAQVWKAALKDLKEPMTWEKFKRIARNMPSNYAGVYGGAGSGYAF
ncbi:hypothetical protein F53441_6557 [Fusarium austroafricanum]|uniref:Uncharacterized protein n=1 Tax=Fusarium austroafricanum TaxID=2364996 RepID=A0A8H4KHJ8_9HYPO|nr:hypothetical protein F53441_6557 [Fusarium austroafricanum]